MSLKKVGSFLTMGDDGKERLVVEYQGVINTTTVGGGSDKCLNGLSEYKLQDGTRVSPLDDGKYCVEISKTTIVLTKI